jgi:DNA-binding NarL/FixJ family response regulator
MDGARNVLVVEVPQALFDRVAPVLRRRSFEVDRFPDAARALELLAAVPFQAVVVGYPMREIVLERFLAAVADGESALASVAVLTAKEHRDEVEGYLNRGVDLILAAENAPEEMQRLLCALFGVAPRSAMRTMVKLEVQLGSEGPTERFMAQTENISTSGMLVVTRRRYPLGTTVGFELLLPAGRGSVSGLAEVARHTEPGQDRVEGIGLRFLSFRDASSARVALALEDLG